jgi:hypothetical protein
MLAAAPAQGLVVPETAPTSSAQVISLNGMLRIGNAAAALEMGRPVDEAQNQQSQPVIQALAGHIKEFFLKAVDARRTVEQEMLEAMLARRGQYTAQKLQQIVEQRQPPIYMMVAAAKMRQIEALLRDVAIDLSWLTLQTAWLFPLVLVFLAFLLDPYGELSLKPLAERYLYIPPTERDAVRDYLYAEKIIKRNVKRWGAHISAAPGTLVGPYAVGDCTRTLALYKHLLPIVKAKGMLPAYRRECEIMPMLLDNSAQGIPLDHKRLARDTKRYEQVLLDVDKHLRMLWPKEIMGGVAPANFDSGDELAECLERDKRIKLPKTPTGKTSTAKDSLLACLPDCRVKGLLVYRSAIEKCLSTYMRPWLAQGAALAARRLDRG